MLKVQIEEFLNPYDRGFLIGETLRSEFHDVLTNAEVFFRNIGMDSATLRAISKETFEAVKMWWPNYTIELEGVSNSTNIPLWKITLLMCHAEILKSCNFFIEEGSTVIRIASDMKLQTLQTWDWCNNVFEITYFLSYKSVTGKTVKVFSQVGSAAKVGVNSKGIGVQVNSTATLRDKVGGIPPTVVVRRILEETDTVAHALSIIESANLVSACAIHVLSQKKPVEAITVEIQPSGCTLLYPDKEGYILYTNHFISHVADGRKSQNSLIRLKHLKKVHKNMISEDLKIRAKKMCEENRQCVISVNVKQGKLMHIQTQITISLDLENTKILYNIGNPYDMFIGTHYFDF